MDVTPGVIINCWITALLFAGLADSLKPKYKITRSVFIFMAASFSVAPAVAWALSYCLGERQEFLVAVQGRLT